MAAEWKINAGTPRHHGLGKLMLAVHALVCGKPPSTGTGDIRIHLIDCMDDFSLAKASLHGRIPSELDAELAQIGDELDQWRPSRSGHPRTSGLFNGGRGKKGLGIALTLAQWIIAVYVETNRYDAIAEYKA